MQSVTITVTWAGDRLKVSADTFHSSGYLENLKCLQRPNNAGHCVESGGSGWSREAVGGVRRQWVESGVSEE